MTQTALARDTGTRHSPARSSLYSGLIGLAALAVLLQGLWAGLFIREGHDFQQFWVEVHARCGEAAIVFAFLASVVALVKLRSRTGIWIGSIALTALLIIEAYLGGLIGDDPGLTALHMPFGMASMALVIWLSTRSVRPAREKH